MTPPERPAPAPHPAFEVIPAALSGPLVFASPHSGAVRPGDFGARPDLPEASLRSAEDIGVDALIACGPGHGIPLILGRITRAYVDLNRDPVELDPGLIDGLAETGDLSAKTAAGFGVIPRRSGDGQDLYERRLMLEEATARLANVHRPYHVALTELMQDARSRHGAAILIDWHSMPSRATGGGTRSRPGLDVVLGDRHGSSCTARLTRRLRALFEGLGWRVGLNQPYAGGWSTQSWGRPAEGFHAIQIELNRALYLDEESLEPSADFDRCRRAVERVIAALAVEEWTKPV